MIRFISVAFLVFAVANFASVFDEERPEDNAVRQIIKSINNQLNFNPEFDESSGTFGKRDAGDKDPDLHFDFDKDSGSFGKR